MDAVGGTSGVPCGALRDIRVSLGRLFGVPGVSFGVVWASLGGPWAVVWPLGCLGGARRENPGNFRVYFGGLLAVFFEIFQYTRGLRFLIDFVSVFLMIFEAFSEDFKSLF